MSNFQKYFISNFSAEGKFNRDSCSSSKRSRSASSFRTGKTFNSIKDCKITDDSSSVLFDYESVKIEDDSDEDTESRKKHKILNLIDGYSDDSCQETLNITANAIIDDADNEEQSETKLDWLEFDDNSKSSPFKSNSQYKRFTRMCKDTAPEEFVNLIKQENELKQKKYVKQSVIHCEYPIRLTSMEVGNDSLSSQSNTTVYNIFPSTSSKDPKSQDTPFISNNKCFTKSNNNLSYKYNTNCDSTPKKEKYLPISHFTPTKDKNIQDCFSFSYNELKLTYKIPVSSKIFTESDNSCDSYKTPNKEPVIIDFTPIKDKSNDASFKGTFGKKFKSSVPCSKQSSAVRKNILSNFLEAESNDYFDETEEDVMSYCTTRSVSVNSKYDIQINESTPEKVCSFKQMSSPGIDNLQSKKNKFANFESTDCVDEFTSTEEELSIFDTSCEKKESIDRICFESSPSVSNTLVIGCVQSPIRTDSSQIENDEGNVHIPGLTPKKTEAQFVETEVFFSKNKKKSIKSGALVGRALAVVSSYKVKNKVSIYELELGLNDNITFSDPLYVNFSWTEQDYTYIKCSKTTNEAININNEAMEFKGESRIPLPESVIVIVTHGAKKIPPNVEIKLSFPIKVFTYSKLNGFIAVANHIQVSNSKHIFENKNLSISLNKISHFKRNRLPDLFSTSIIPFPGYLILKNSMCFSLKEAHFLFPLTNCFSIEVSVQKMFFSSPSFNLLTIDKDNTHCIISLPLGASKQAASVIVGKKGIISDIVMTFIKYPVTQSDVEFQGEQIIKPIPKIMYYASPRGHLWTLNENFFEINN